MDRADYNFFLRRIKEYLGPRAPFPSRGNLNVRTGKISSNNEIPSHNKSIQSNRRPDHRKNVTLLAYCLMPNHFHLLVINESERGIESFMRSLATSYSRYFNEKYGRVGPLFQDVYRAASVPNEGVLIHLARYIHRNPIESGLCSRLEEYPYSNYRSYLYGKGEDWFDIKTILELFPKGGLEYRIFVEESEKYENEYRINNKNLNPRRSEFRALTRPEFGLNNRVTKLG